MQYIKMQYIKIQYCSLFKDLISETEEKEVKTVRI